MEYDMINWLESLTERTNFVFVAFDVLGENAEVKEFYDEYIEWMDKFGTYKSKYTSQEVVDSNLIVLLGKMPRTNPKALWWKYLLNLKKKYNEFYS
jgi:hypothetical protein